MERDTPRTAALLYFLIGFVLTMLLLAGCKQAQQPALKRELRHLTPEAGTTNYGPAPELTPRPCPQFDGVTAYIFEKNGETPGFCSKHVRLLSADTSVATLYIEGFGPDGKWYVIEQYINPTKEGVTLTYEGRWRNQMRRVRVVNYAAGRVVVEFWDERPKP